MKLKSIGIWSAFALLAVTTACTKASPTRPTDNTASGGTAAVTDATTGVTLTAPTPVSPTANQQFKFAEQPLTLTVANAVSTGSTPLTYTFGDGDSAFCVEGLLKDSVAAGSADVAEDRHASGPAKTTSGAQVCERRPTGPYRRFADSRSAPAGDVEHAAPVSPVNGAPTGAGDSHRQQRPEVRPCRPGGLPVRDLE
jgi:hypothetical protein